MGANSDTKVSNEATTINIGTTASGSSTDEVAEKVKAVNLELLDKMYTGMINGMDVNQIRGYSEIFKNIN